MKLDTRTLRAVGEDLQRIQLFDFDLELDGKKCLVRGTVAPPEMPEQSVERSSWEGLSGLWKQFRSPETDVRRVPARMPVERVYLQEDVDRLDAEGRSRRRDSQGCPDLYSTPEILRAAAAYVESKGGQLVRLSKTGSQLQFDYQTRSETRQVEVRSFSEMYDFAFQMYLKRKKEASEEAPGDTSQEGDSLSRAR